MATPFSKRAYILGELYETMKDEDKGEFETFWKYNDIGLPLAFMFAKGFVTELSDEGTKFINETWDLFSGALGLDENYLYQNFAEVMEWVDNQ